jgi:hypothetical protein
MLCVCFGIGELIIMACLAVWGVIASYLKLKK